MTVLSIPALIMAVIAFYIFGYHLLIYFRRQESRVDLTFALTALCIGFYDVFCVALYNATSPLEGVQVQRWQLISLSALSIAYAWFVVDYTSMKDRKGPWFFSIIFLVFGLVGLFDRSGLAWTSQPLIKNFQFPIFGWEITYYEMEFGIVMLYEAFMLMVFYLYLYLVGIHFYWKKNPRKAKPLVIAIGLFFLGMTEDVFVALGYYSFIYTIEFAFLGMILVMAYALSSEIVEKTKIQQKLKDSESKHKEMIANISDVIAILGSDGIIKYKSPNIKKWFGWHPEDLVNVNFWDSVHSDDLGSIQKEFSTLLEKNNSVKNVEFNYECKDGSYKPIELTAINLTEKSKIDGVLINFHDITKRKQIENELKKYRDHLEELVKNRTIELEAKNKELEVFTYSVSHDLKAPLRGIDGYSRLLVKEYADKLDEEGVLFLNYVRQSTTQMNQLIEDLLSYSRMERRDLQPVSIDLHSVVDLLIDQREHEIKTKNIRVSVNLPFQMLTSDSETLRQVLGNYLDNAIKFLKKDEPGKVDIGGQETDESWTLWVRDNGIGFDLQYHDRIFNIFQRLHRAEDYPGTGIGLAIVRKAIERIRGRAWAESKLGEGAAFFIDIPKKDGFAQKEKQSNETQ